MLERWAILQFFKIVTLFSQKIVQFAPIHTLSPRFKIASGPMYRLQYFEMRTFSPQITDDVFSTLTFAKSEIHEELTRNLSLKKSEFL